MTVPPSPSSSTVEPDPVTGPFAVVANDDDARPRARAEHLTDLLSRLVAPIEGNPRWGWIGAIAVTVLAAIMRLVKLDVPARLVFDETYYVKQAYSLLTLGYEGQWAEEIAGYEEPNDAFAAGDFSGLSSDPEYVVHPPLGKWLIAIGMKALGPESIVGWRLSAAIAGTIAVFLVARIGRRLLGSTLLGTTAGLLLAVDGIHVVMSRTGLLDIFLSTLVLAAFGTLLLDRDWYRRRLAERTADALVVGDDRDPWGARVGPRWWLVATGVLLGAACGVKWSALYAVAVFGILAVVWSITARRAAGVRLWVGAGMVRDGLSAFVALVPVALVTYLAAWASWFASTGAYNRHWATTVNDVSATPQRTWLPDSLNSLVEYHLQVWHFHVGLDSEHSYSSHPVGWLLQLRPTSFAWRDVETPADGSGRWVEAVLAVGNPVIWWGGAVALLVLLWFAVRRRDWRAWAILGGYAAMYLPWFTYSAPFANRTIFTFYTVAFVPFVVLALVYLLGVVLGRQSLPSADRRWRAGVYVGIVAATLVMAAFFWPIWIGEPIPYEYWRSHMWIPNVESLRIGWI
ncbi:dolichyl-phosphate-mannose--protein mannosyltransferase [Salana multivorans]